MDNKYYRIGQDGKAYFGKKGAGILFTDGHKILLLKRDDGHEKGAWGIPGGKAEEDELDIDTAVRETEEECGNIQGQRIGKFEEKDNQFHWTTFLYRVQKPFDCKLSKEHSDYKWIPIEDLDKYTLHSKFKENLPYYLKSIKNKFENRMSFREFFNQKD